MELGTDLRIEFNSISYLKQRNGNYSSLPSRVCQNCWTVTNISNYSPTYYRKWIDMHLLQFAKIYHFLEKSKQNYTYIQVLSIALVSGIKRSTESGKQCLTVHFVFEDGNMQQKEPIDLI